MKNPLKFHYKSDKKINGKPKREIHQYVGVGNDDILSRIEITRNKNGKSKIFHRVFRWANGVILSKK
ncbi:MAG: hypothetical protein PHH24_03140 [Candidatus Moranbacteria bacterium]|nr:hypothetical protein [Candidatus Moranbacteria bacterium]MDD5651874.1 hypothetical protein [Candidatus Moranbacteria bacterium]MDX9855236.1 hypothetical protein [Candidatus Moranbacteria bacterium]